jgi:predicted DNA-binding WGR domain protein
MMSYMEKNDPAKNQARFYNLILLPNLFGEWTLYREWGRIGQGGKVRMEWFGSEDEAKVALVTLEVAKRRRGYWLRPEQLPDPAALFMEIIPFYLFRIDHSAFSRFEETPIGNWDVWLNVINVEADGGAREGDLFAAFYGPSQHADNWREQMMFASTVLDPLVWSGLLIEVKPPKGKRADSEYFKTPLWRKALTLDTDGALMPRSEH